MPLPFLIAGALGVAAIAALSKSSDDDKDNGRSQHDIEEEERERRENRERKEQRKNISQEVEFHIKNNYSEIEQALPKYVSIEGIPVNQIKLSKKYNSGLNKRFTFPEKNNASETNPMSHLTSLLDEIGRKRINQVPFKLEESKLREHFSFCSQKDLSSMNNFMQIYAVELTPSNILKKECSDIESLELELKKLEQEIKALKHNEFI